MSNTVKHTPGPWKAIKMVKGGFYEITKKINDDDSLQCDLIIHEGREAEAEANAQLIAEAGTVAHETGKTPRQLADLNKELLEALKLLTEAFDKPRLFEYTELQNRAKIAKKAIKKATE